MGLKIWLLVPVKPLGEGKSRLAGELDHVQRSALSQRLLGHLLSVAHDSKLFSGILVVSRDDLVLQIATDAGVATMHEPGHGLNDALRAAREQVLQWGAGAIVVLPSDLPWVTKADLEALVTAGSRAHVVLAPSQDGGTNALYLRPPNVINFSYGKQSALRHTELAEKRGLSTVLVESPTLAFDIDSPADFRRLAHAGRS